MAGQNHRLSANPVQKVTNFILQEFELNFWKIGHIDVLFCRVIDVNVGVNIC